MPTLIVNQQTWAKATTDPSGELPGDQKALLTAGEYEILAYGEASTDDRYSNQDHAAVHMVVTFDPDDLPVAVHNDEGTRLNTVVLYHGHAEVEGNIPGNKPKDSEPANPPKGKGVPFSLIGFKGTYYSGDPVASDTPNITWGEVLHFSGSRHREPHSPTVVKNLITISRFAQRIRDRYGRPMRIHSGFRDRATNKAVGGASQSLHVQGGAIDFSIAGLRCKDIYDDLNPTWGAGLAYSPRAHFVHIDCRAGYGLDGKGGYRARWTY
jgi:hypothetical protein